MRLVDMLPSKDGQLFATGRKGSGKSTLVRQLMTKLGDNEIIVVIDSKHEWDLPRLRIHPMMLGNKVVRPLHFTNVKLVRNPGIYIYQSKYPHYYDPGVSRILVSAYNRKNVTIVVHEVYHFCHGANALPALAQAIVQGRAKHLRLFLESQRPANIPIICETEAEVYIEFMLQKKSDRQRMADVSGFMELEQEVEDMHDFWVGKLGWKNAVYIKNTLENDASWDLLRKKPKTTDTKEQSLAPMTP